MYINHSGTRTELIREAPPWGAGAEERPGSSACLRAAAAAAAAAAPMNGDKRR